METTRWISIEESLPEDCNKYVLVKNYYGDIALALCEKETHAWILNDGRIINQDDVEYWRPIEFEIM